MISLRNLIDKTKCLQRKTIDIDIFFHVSLKRKDVFMVQEKSQTFKLGSLGRWKTGKMTDVLQMGSKYILPEWDTARNSKNLCVILENKKKMCSLLWQIAHWNYYRKEYVLKMTLKSGSEM